MSNSVKYMKGAFKLDVWITVLVVLFVFAAASKFEMPFFGKSKTDLIIKNAEAQHTLKMMDDVAKSNKVVRGIEQGNIEDNRQAVTNIRALQKDSVKKTSEIHQKQMDTVQRVQQDPVLTVQEKEVKEAEAQIDMLWENFCRIEKSSCKDS